MSKLLPIKEPNEEKGASETVGYIFYCPGCDSHHDVYIRPHTNSVGASWSFTGSFDRPTFSPSINVKVEKTNGELILRCHFFVADGSIRYLDDCTHRLAGQTVELPDI
jgi:hypothetical protein